MRFASLGSGSKGNALLVESGRTRVLIDCGFGPRELATRLARLGLAPDDLDAILVTHEHGDHVGGVTRAAGRFSLSVHMSHGTHAAAGLAGKLEASLFDSHSTFALGDLQVHPFPVPHDAREPTQFVIGDGQWRLGVLTDAGCITPHMVEMLNGCDSLVLECNHDLHMLENGSYPLSLKRRVGGRLGHLDNAVAADLLGRIDRRRLQHVVAAHLSEQNNTSELARTALAGAMGCSQEWIGVAGQVEGFGWREIRTS
ncbi:MAG: MBL fold metallo-hydrolase [Gammaproteobacteria bacterium]|nr:MBL fold metallo-hydrolase [Gammaproteobacteria bacterium]MBU1646758.1 MBL fold metallo-hydrolase [Gammaproteobacteria bacterium]MBU1971792.1 MBL fold metallo-hydrolase [Gammaproteobacteria bacterium]